jgi:cellobiose epimerase
MDGETFVNYMWILGISLASLVPQAGLTQTPAQTAKPAAAISYLPPTSQSYLKFADETETVLRRDILDLWFPAAIDNEHGGFHSDFGRDWKATRSGGKFSVFQGRMTWVGAEVAIRRPELRDRFLPVANHGVKFLRNVLWDKQFGGFFWGLDDNGNISPSYTDGKELYGESFALYGAANAYRATHDPQALELAQKAFRWMDEHAHDSVNGGYFEWLTRDGRVVQADLNSPLGKMVPLGGFSVGYKSMNTHIHLLEALTQLYEVWKDDTVRRRLEELLALVRDKICVQPGVMNLFFTPGWRPIPDLDSYGHDVEAAYLMLEAEDVLGHGHDARTERMAKMLVDHALAYGWDEDYGGFFGEGTTFGKPERRAKEWWVEFEGLNALLLMHEKYGQGNDAYFKAFQKQWQFIKDYQLDPEYRGVYQLVDPDGKPLNANKGAIWKAAYHDSRALMNVGDRLHRLADSAK